jgi:Copper chaperone
MGFDASLPTSEDSATCKLHVEGMTGNSCVQNIESVVSAKPGVKVVKVNLDKKEAVVTFSSSMLTPSQVAEYVSDMGFDGTVKEADNAIANGGM